MTTPTEEPGPLIDRLRAAATEFAAWLTLADPPQVGDDEDRPEDLMMEPAEIERIAGLLGEAADALASVTPAAMMQRMRTMLAELASARGPEIEVLERTTPEALAEGRMSFAVRFRRADFPELAAEADRQTARDHLRDLRHAMGHTQRDAAQPGTVEEISG